MINPEKLEELTLKRQLYLKLTAEDTNYQHNKKTIYLELN